MSDGDALTERSVEIDYGDYGDDADATMVDGRIASAPVAGNGKQRQQQMVARQGNVSSLEKQQDVATIPIDNEHHPRHHRNQCNQSHHHDMLATRAEKEELDNSVNQACRNHCPHHPRERLIRFDPAGQAWCDRLECWDCYCLMRIGETLGYPSLSDGGGSHLIDEGMEAWAAFVLGERAFEVTWATQVALARCKALGIKEPDLSDEAKQLVKLPPSSL